MMGLKVRLLCASVLAIWNLAAGAQSAPQYDAKEAQAELEAIDARSNAPVPEQFKEDSREYWLFMDNRYRQFIKDARAFAAKFPGHPNRWNLIVGSGYGVGSANEGDAFIKGFKPEFDRNPVSANVIYDPAGRETFVREQFVLLQEVLDAPDATRDERGGSFEWMWWEAIAAAKREGKPLDVAPFRAMVDRSIARFPDERSVVVALEYLNKLRGLGSSYEAQADEFQASLRSSPIAADIAGSDRRQQEAEAARNAAAKARAADIGSIRFTALDGREVDLGKLRGKVVLVDFWATWCAPCIKELPNVKRVYDAYHGKGFEVIGIALDDERDRRKLLDFVAERKLPWPQHFDGKRFRNEFAQRFGVDAIPAMYLLDKEGRVVSADARGEELEKEVKRLLEQ